MSDSSTPATTLSSTVNDGGASLARQPWSSGLYDCCDDIVSCLMSARFPAITFGLNKERLDGSSACESCCAYFFLHLVCMCCIVHAPMRGALRDKYNLEESGCNDCVAVTFCPCCALAQEARELNYRQPASAPAVQKMNSS